MDDPVADFEQWIQGRMVEVYSANPWIVAIDSVQAAVRIAGRVRDLGDAPVLAVGARAGMGPLGEEVRSISLDLPPSDDAMTDMHTALAGLRSPPSHVVADIDRWDPDRRARTVGGFTASRGSLAARPTFGAREPAWEELEDKLAIEALWAEAGIATAPSRQVAIDDPAALLAAHRELASAAGTVWAVDNDAGWHGGASGTHWVPDEATARELPAALAEHRLVRVMPFVEGVPCSIHGMVVADGDGAIAVPVFRPTEMLTLRDPAGRRLVYSRASTYWDPDPADRVAMQDAARRIGEALAARAGYRGTFTVDGVVGADGFVPTEVNTRYGAALRPELPTVGGGPPMPLYLLHLAIVEGRLDGLDPAMLERWVTGQLDEHRWASAMLQDVASPDHDRAATVRRVDGGRLVVEEDALDGPEDDGPAGSEDEDGDGPDEGRNVVATARWAGGWRGGIVMVDFGAAVPVGPPTAPVWCEVVTALDERWGLGAPELVAAREAR